MVIIDEISFIGSKMLTIVTRKFNANLLLSSNLFPSSEKDESLREHYKTLKTSIWNKTDLWNWHQLSLKPITSEHTQVGINPIDRRRSILSPKRHRYEINNYIILNSTRYERASIRNNSTTYGLFRSRCFRLLIVHYLSWLIFANKL